MTSRILLVEDDISCAEDMAAVLHLDGFDVTIAHDVGRACANMLREQFDAIVLDCVLPAVVGLPSERGGLHLVRWVRAGDDRVGRRNADVPIIISTASSNREMIQELASLGVQKILMKPFLTEELTACLQQMFAREEP